MSWPSLSDCGHAGHLRPAGAGGSGRARSIAVRLVLVAIVGQRRPELVACPGVGPDPLAGGEGNQGSRAVDQRKQGLPAGQADPLTGGRAT